LFAIWIEITTPKVEELLSTIVGEKSEAIRERVANARKIQQTRFQDEGIQFNSQMHPAHIQRFCQKLPADGQRLLELAINRCGMSAADFDQILQVARTIADLSGDSQLQTHHIAEAIQYRRQSIKL
jgi:magnesium chelatase family protein